MNRYDVVKKLQLYVPTVQEYAFKEEMIAFINTYEDCFERSLEIGHITAASWLLNKDQSKALLTHHAKLNAWLQLGGHCDGNPDVLAVAIKEAQEESGINGIVAFDATIFDIDIHLIPENKKEKAHYHYDICFLLQVISDEQEIKSDESKDLRWISKDKKSLPTDNLRVGRLFDKWLYRK